MPWVACMVEIGGILFTNHSWLMIIVVNENSEWRRVYCMIYYRQGYNLRSCLEE